MQNCISEIAKKFLGFLAFLVFYFKCATAEIKHCFISVLVKLYRHHNVLNSNEITLFGDVASKIPDTQN